MDEHELHIVAIDRTGAEHRVPALDGWTVMEIVRDAGLPLKAECGGALQCATCHVYVDPNWIERIPPPIEEEEERLDDAFLVKASSRLSCQILMRDDLDGFRVTLAPDGED